jgi:alpha-1,3-rhamnosyl/mannosyltransferase
MSQGTAVVASDIPVLREVAGGAARLVAPDDVDGWSAALAALLGDPVARAELGGRGLERAAAFSWERCVAATAAVYREAVG